MRNSALLLFLIAQMSTSFNYYVAKRMVTKRMESIQLSMSTNARGYNSNNNYYNNNNNNNNNNNMNSDAQAEGGERGISAPRFVILLIPSNSYHRAFRYSVVFADQPSRLGKTRAGFSFQVRNHLHTSYY